MFLFTPLPGSHSHTHTFKHKVPAYVVHTILKNGSRDDN